MAEPALITAQEAVDLIKAESGSSMTATTFRAYTYRGQAPGPVKTVGRTPLYSRKKILEWAQNRPGSGARTDIVEPKRQRKTAAATTKAAPAPTRTEAVARRHDQTLKTTRDHADPKGPSV